MCVSLIAAAGAHQDNVGHHRHASRSKSAAQNRYRIDASKRGSTVAKTKLRDIVVLIPGITGSVLQKDDKDLWAISARSLWETLRTRGSWLDHLRLSGDDESVEDLQDGIRATRLMPDVHIVPGLINVDGYSKISRSITERFDVIKGSLVDPYPANFFEFPYDWRRDNRVTAKSLKQLVNRQLPIWREYTGSQSAKMILVAHSMGGLISRYFLEVLGGWECCRALVTFGTPFRGSLNSLDYLANGYKKLMIDLTDVLRSHTSIYQLLPIYPSVRHGGEYHRVAELPGIPDISQSRAQAALSFHRQIEDAVQRNRKNEAYLSDPYLTIPIVGTVQPTYQSADFVSGEVIANRDLPDYVDPLLSDGDGTVPRLSATPIDASTQFREAYFPERHGSLQSNDHVIHNLLSTINQMQILGLKDIRGPRATGLHQTAQGLSLDLDDAYLHGEAIDISIGAVGIDAEQCAVAAKTTRVDSGSQENFKAIRDGDTFVLSLDKLKPGIFRLEVSTETPNGRLSVNGSFEIVNIGA